MPSSSSFVMALLLVGCLALSHAWVLPATTTTTRKPSTRSAAAAPAFTRPLCLPSAASRASSFSALHATEGGNNEGGGNKLPMLLDVETRGGILFVSTIGTAAVFGAYSVATALGADGLQVGIYISVAMTIGMVAWTLSYIFRVANKDMTYAKQLKNYEDAVLAKRLEELEEDEVEALLEEVDKEGSRL